MLTPDELQRLDARVSKTEVDAEPAPLTAEQLQRLDALVPETGVDAEPATLTAEQLQRLDALVPLEEKPPLTEKQILSPFNKRPESSPVPVQEEQSDPSVLADIGRVMFDVGENIAYAPAQLVNLVSEQFTGEPVVTEDMFRLARQEAVKNISTPMRSMGFKRAADALDSAFLTEDGDIKETETLTGTAFSIAPYIVGAVNISKLKYIKDLTFFKKGIVSGGAINQILSDPDAENFFNAAETYLPENLQNDFVSYMASKKDDTQLEKRLKLVVEELTIGMAGELIGGTAKLSWWASKLFGKEVSKLTKSERGQIVMAHAKSIKDTAVAPIVSATSKLGSRLSPKTSDSYFDDAEFNVDLAKPEGRVVYEEAPDAAKQVAKQNAGMFKGALNRMTGQFFSSRGYWSKKAFNAFENSQYAQRQAIATAENTANRLEKHLDDIVETKEGEQIMKTVQGLFDDQLDFTFTKGNLSFDEQVIDVSNQFNLPKNISTELVNARNQIDELSKTLVNSSAVPDDLKEAIVEGAGKYLRTSYRLFEDAGYVPSADVKKEARDYLIKQLQKFDPDLSDQFAFNKANTTIDDILKEGDAAEASNYLGRVSKVNKQILKSKNTNIAPEIRALMGEIKEPGENIILTVSKMTKLAETNKFFETFKQLGESGGYLFKDTDKFDADKFVKIQGTNSNLDGMYTTKPMAKAIYNEQGTIQTLRKNSGYKKYLRMQSTVQKWKTVYSHMTHLKNISGGAVMSAANGVNPFSKNSIETFRLLRNSIKQGGDAALDASYEKLLRHGIINTNVQVNEYRELLETGYRANEKEGFKWLNKTAYGKSINEDFVVKGEKVLKTAEDVYVATDDFYKINTYLSELETLKNANTGKSLDVLEAEAARITQNTYANYDRVPYGIKMLKDLPFGSFVSFPAESIRVQVNILRQGARELASGNEVIVARGMQRISGAIATNTGIGYAGTASAKLVFGNDDEKAKAAHILSEKPWSKVAPRIWQTNEEGEIYYWDTASHDPFTAVKDPLRIIKNAVLSGNLKGEELDKRLMDLTIEASLTLAKPFISKTILFDIGADVAHALTDPRGRTSKGKELFPEGMPVGDKIEAATGFILNSGVPGTIKSGIDLVKVMGETPNRLTGKTKDLSLELAKNLSSVNVEKLDVEDAMLYAVMDFNRTSRNIVSVRPDYLKKGPELEARYDARQQTRYRAEQELYRKVDAARTLVGESEAARMLFKADLSKNKIAEILSNVFIADKPSDNLIAEMFQKTPNETPEELHNSLNAIILRFQELSGTPLNVPSDPSELATERMQTMQRLQKATGGEVSKEVPNAPAEPDERINKLTGLPYNEEAGPAYMDQDDPMRLLNMAAGGRVKMSAAGAVVKLAEKVAGQLTSLKGSSDDVVETVAQKQARRRAENSDSMDTQIGSTTNTAIKAADYLDEQGAKGLTLDYGAGFGKNAKAIKADATFEPFPKEGFKPTYIDPTLIPEGKFDRLISTNVINVLPKDIRDEAIVTIGKSLKSGGKAVVQTWDIGSNTARLRGKNFKAGEEANSSISLAGGKFQKGFTNPELKKYIQEILGDGFEVSIVPPKRKVGKVATLITKLPEGTTRVKNNKGGKVYNTLKRNCS